MSNAMSRSKSRWKGALLATVATAVISPMVAKAQSTGLTVGIFANPLGGAKSPNAYSGSSNVYIDPLDTDTLYVYATVTGTQAPSTSYVDGLNYLYFNVNASATGTAGLGMITAATPSALFGGGSFNQTSGNTAPSAGAQGGLISTTAYSATPSIAVGSNSAAGSLAKPRSAGDVYFSGTGASSPNIVVSGNSVSFLVETLTYKPCTANTVNSGNAATPVPGTVSFNVSIPSSTLVGPSTIYPAANYFVGLSTTPALGAQPSAVSTLNYNASATNVTMINALPGDANLDGLVNGSDLAIVNSSFNTSGVTGGYTAGDLNEDGLINGTDLAIVNSNFNTSLLSTYGNPAGLGAALPNAAIGSSAVPEPTSLAMLALGGLSLLGRKRSKI